MEVVNNKVSIKTLHLEQLGYGIDGKLTRKEWHEECLRMLLAGYIEFNAWQEKLINTNVSALKKEAAVYEWEISNGKHAKAIEKMTVWDNIPFLVFDFSQHVFEEALSLDNYVFRGLALFNGVTFKGQVSFKNTLFAEGVFVIGSTFFRGAIFSQASFHKRAIFDYSVFESIVFDGDSEFKALASFKYVEFQSDASFRIVAFNAAVFDGALFVKNADFSSGKSVFNNVTEFLTFGRISFSGTHFCERANFSNRDFKGIASFEEFEGHPTRFDMAPLFHNCTLHQDITFAYARFPDNQKPDKEAARAYNTLRHAMSQQQATREEQRFLTLELDAERLMAGKWVSGLYWLYKKLANYGFSVAKPFIFLVCLPFAVGVLFYGGLASIAHCNSIFSQSCQLDSDLSGKTIMFSVLHSLPPLGLDKLSEPLTKALFGVLPDGEIKEYSTTLAAIMVLQKVLSLAGWFFVALALRNLFKMK